MAKVKRFAPDSLEQRKGAKHTRYVSTGSVPTTLDGVQLHLSPTEREHLFSVPNEEGPEFRRLRRFGLLLSRYGLVDKNRFIRRNGVSHEIATVAERVIATRAYKEAFGGDPTIGVANVQPLVNMLNSPSPSPSIIQACLAYSGTRAGQDILAGIKDNDLRSVVHSAMEQVTFYSEYSTHEVMWHMNRQGRGHTRRAFSAYDRVITILQRGTGDISKAVQSKQEEQSKKPSESSSGKYNKSKLKRRTEAEMHGARTKVGHRHLREIVASIDGWDTALLDKMPLTLPHTGRKGRKLIPMPYGKSIRFIVREDTDPEQRVFARKTRSQGGIVVVDCSGSMGFDSSDLDKIMAATAGATVLCYSSGGDDNEPNIWLVAKGGRRTSTLPHFPGNNGVDGPALEYGLSLRRHNEPVVWVSDTAVTGRGDVASSALRDWCLDFCSKHGIYIVRHTEQAATALRKLQLGQRPDRTNYKKLRREH